MGCTLRPKDVYVRHGESAFLASKFRNLRNWIET